MKALVTGATSSLGQIAAEELRLSGFEVISWSRRQCDLSIPEQTFAKGRQLAKSEPGLAALVHAAGVGRFAPHEQLPESALTEMASVNFLSPMLLTSALLRRLRQNRGLILYLSSIEADRQASGAACYGACKSGFQHFLKTIYEENRRQGLRVSILKLGMVRTEFYRRLDFEPHSAADAALNPEDLRPLLRSILSAPQASSLTELTFQPNRPRVERKSVQDCQDKQTGGAN